MDQMNKQNRVLVIGYDGATWDLAETWAKTGKLPALASLMQRGGYGPLQSVMPVLSPAAWASFATGVHPGKHGIFDFVQRQQNDYRLRLVTASDLRRPVFWSLASQAGKRAAIVNVPLTYPANEINGVMITGLGTPEGRPFTYPLELGPEIKKRGYRVNRIEFYKPGREEAYLRDVYDMTDRLADISLDLFCQEPWDLFVVVFRDLDEVSHYFWKHMDKSHPQHDPLGDVHYADVIERFYRHLDRQLARFIEAAGPEVDVMVISDHGFGPLYKDVYLNEWLKQEGFLAMKTSSGSRSLLQRAMLRLGLTRQRVSHRLQDMGLAVFERRLRRLLQDQLDAFPAHDRAVFPEAVDWSRSRAYSFGYHGQIFVNLRGREPGGIVDPGQDYEKLLTMLEDKLANLVDPQDGLPVVTKMIRGRELFGEAIAHGAPDLVLLMRDLAYITRQGYEFGPIPGTIFQQPAGFETGSHREMGMAAFAGPHFVRRSWHAPYSLTDIAPTIMHLLGIVADIQMDGRVLHEQLTVASEGQSLVSVSARASSEGVAPDVEPVLSPEEEQEMAERLRRLGYLG